jgi:hypothetical protein
LQTTDDADDIIVVAVSESDRPMAHYASSLERWDADADGAGGEDAPDYTNHESMEDTDVNGNQESTGEQRTNIQQGQYVQWDWSGGTGYGQVIEKVTEPGTSRTVSGNTRTATEDRNVLVIGHLSEDGDNQSQRVVKYEDNVDNWDQPSSVDSLNTIEAYHHDALLNHTLAPQPLADNQRKQLELVMNVEVDGEEIDLTPPSDVQEIAQDFLDAHDNGLIPDSCGMSDVSSVGYTRAEQLAEGNELAVDDIMAAGSGMYGWFQRHGEQGNGNPQTEQQDDESEREANYRDCGYASWRAWGGDPAWEWATDVHEQIVAARENALVDNPSGLFQWMKTALGLGRSNADRDTTDDDETNQETTANHETNEQDADMSDDNGSGNQNQSRSNATLEPEQIAEHTIFTTDMLSEMDEDMLETVEEQLLIEMFGDERNAEHGENEEEHTEMTDNNEDDTVTNTDADTDGTTSDNTDDSEYVTAEELDERLNSLEDSLTETVEEAIESERTNHERQQQVEIVSNAIDGMTKEAAEALPDDELDTLAEKHGGNRANYAGVPGSVDRTPDEDGDNEFEDYPAGGRTNYAARSEGD